MITDFNDMVNVAKVRCLLIFIPLVSWYSGLAQNEKVVDINLDVKHSVEGVYKFDRKKFINIHAGITERDWNGDEDKLKYIVEDLDVYLGRDNGSINWSLNQSNEDPNKAGYVDPNYMKSSGLNFRENVYGINSASRHKYEDHVDIIYGGQVHPLWDGVTNPCCKDTKWNFGADAAGDYLGQYFNEFFREEGQPSTKGLPRPKYMEILNEPLYELTTTGSTPPLDVFLFHNQVADAMRIRNSEVLIGGYTTAFPFFDVNNFQRWNDRMKLFIDTSGEKMDFFSIHLYDFNENNPRLFRGGRMEATMDMIENYSMIKLGTVKPFYLSEYGGRNRPIESGVWTPFRDWQTLKSLSSMTMAFMDRPNKVLKAIPFIVTKAEWGRQDNGNPYPWRLLRQAFEGEGETGDNWVFTEMVKYYELWSDVNGVRVDSKSQNADVLVDAYVDKNKAYVIFSNLDFTAKTIQPKLIGNSSEVQSVKVKHLFLAGSAPRLNIETFTSLPDEVIVSPEATMILEYQMADDQVIDQTSEEIKYYASTYLKPINSAEAATFSINGVAKGEKGEAVLRIGVGRNHGASLRPEVKLNGAILTVPTNLSGDDQKSRDAFYGLLEIPVSNDLLSENNTISIKFNESGGHIASVTLQVFQFSREVVRFEGSEAVTGLEEPTLDLDLYPNPTKGILNFSVEANEDFSVSVLDLEGKSLLNKQISPNSQSIDLTGLSKGLYIVVVETKLGKKSYKITLE